MEKESAVALERQRLYLLYLNLAESNRIQSPRHWALRQVLSGKSEGQVKDKLNRRKSSP
jgi:hypothetical protein